MTLTRSQLFAATPAILFLASSSSSSLQAQSLPVVPAGLIAEVVATGLPPNTVDIEIAPASFGSFGGQVFIAVLDDSADHTDGRILAIDPLSGTTTVFADATVAPDPWGLEFGRGAFTGGLYVNTWVDGATSQREGSIDVIDSAGIVTNLGRPNPAMSSWGGVDIEIDQGPRFGGKLYTGSAAGPSGDVISCITTAGGRATSFFRTGTSSFNGSPGGLALGNGAPGFSGDLFLALRNTGTSGLASGIYTIDPSGGATVFATIASFGSLVSQAKDLEFGRGGAVGRGLLVGTPEGVLSVDSSGNGTMLATLPGPTGGEWIAVDNAGAVYFVDESQDALIRVRGSDTASYRAFGDGCPGSDGATPQLRVVPTSLPRIGRPFRQELTSYVGNPFVFIGFNTFNPVPLDLLGLSGCAILTGWVDRLTPIEVVPGRATLSLNIPNIPAFAANDLYFQAAIVDLGANQLNVSLSNGAVADIGL